MHNSYANKQQQRLEPEKKYKKRKQKTKIRRQAKILVKFRNINELRLRD